MNQTQGHVCIVTALACEARPMLEAFALRQRIEGPGGVKLYHSGAPKDAQLSLLVTGVGEIAMASALGWASMQSPGPSRPEAAWLNVGIAGHGHLAIGSVFEVLQLRHHSLPELMYTSPLQLPNDAPSRTAGSLCTVATAEHAFADECAYDMEGYAFFGAGQRFAHRENLQLLKVISDGPDTDPNSLNATRIRELISLSLEAQRHHITALLANSAEAAEMYPELELSPFLDRWHFSATRQRQLREELRRSAAYKPGHDPLALVEGLQSAAAVLERLRQHNDNVVPNLDRSTHDASES